MVCGRLSVRLIKTRGHGDILERKVEVKVQEDPGSQKTVIVNILQLMSWPKSVLPQTQSVMALLQMLTATLMKTSNKKSVIMCRFVETTTTLVFYCYHHSDGVVRSGTFLVIHSQLERLKTEGVVDVFQAIKSARMHRPGVIPNTVG